MTSRARTHELTLFAFLATAIMLFAGFTAAYLIRRTATDWRHIALPAIFWLNTALLLASSVTVEMARRTGGSGWLVATLALGLGFVVGQVLGWSRLATEGIYLPTYPHSSFIYVLTAVHGMHLLGGLIALGYVAVRRRTPHLAATYWHFADGAWLYLLILLTVL